MVGRSDIFVLRGRVVGGNDLEVRKRGIDIGKIWRRVLVVRVWSIHLSTCI